LTRKTQRQEISTNNPPMTGPAAAAVPPTAAHRPIASPRFSGGNSGSSRPSDDGVRIAAPAACATRAATRTSTDGAAAHAALATVKSARPPRNARLRPVRSAQRPAGTRSAAKTIAYALSTQESDASDVPSKSRWMSGNAMLTMKRSRLATKTPTETIAATRARWLMGLPFRGERSVA
jgi:hypothetical protein